MSEFVWSEYSVEDLEELARQAALSRFNRLADDIRSEVDENIQLAGGMERFVLPAAPSIPQCNSGTLGAVEESITALRAVMASYRTSINSAVSRHIEALDSKQDDALDSGLCDMLRRDQAGLAMEIQMRRGLMSAEDMNAADLQDIQRTAVEYISTKLGDSDLPPEVEARFEALVRELDPNIANVKLERLIRDVDAVVSTAIAIADEAARSKANQRAQLVADAIADELRGMNYSVSNIEIEDNASSRFYAVKEEEEEEEEETNAIEVRFDHERQAMSSEVVQISGQGNDRATSEILRDDEAAVTAWCGEDGYQRLKRQMEKRGIALGGDGVTEWRGKELRACEAPLLTQALEGKRRKKSRKRGKKKELRYRTRKLG